MLDKMPLFQANAKLYLKLVICLVFCWCFKEFFCSFCYICQW